MYFLSSIKFLYSYREDTQTVLESSKNKTDTKEVHNKKPLWPIDLHTLHASFLEHITEFDSKLCLPYQQPDPVLPKGSNNKKRQKNNTTHTSMLQDY